MITTADLCDTHSDMIATGDLHILQGTWRWFGKAASMRGPIVTLQAHGCNTELREQLDQPGLGRILVIEAGDDPGALLGENLSMKALLNGWAGFLINGNVRDSRSLSAIDLPVLALGSWPARSKNEPGGMSDVILEIGGARLSPGDWLYADSDGVLLSRVQLKTN
ncbi:ribonuclease [Pseudomonas putida]|uniref:4-hydroxy-4-methyl-2-oxoglutarate aldolase n=1 Tax=Pseudomonas putida TaxID=303 RepID=A0A6I6XYS4_PSEPU|nr:ribonuclease [Pseudomonas putida]QHG65198.1 ribonuclease [Pseudomonas putida]